MSKRPIKETYKRDLQKKYAKFRMKEMGGCLLST